MRYLALAADYDGTLASNGVVDEPTVAGLERLRESGRRLILVSGRELEDLLRVFPQFGLFERIVAENGALLYRPSSREEKLLTEPPPEALIEALRRKGVDPLSVGRSIVATWVPHQDAVLQAIRELGLEWHVIFNKGAVMALPSGVNKATGLKAALEELRLSPHNVVGVGDAENDHAFLSICELSAAVANALPTLKERADVVTTGDHGRGVVELIEKLVTSDLEEFSPLLTRRFILLGHRQDGSEEKVDPYGQNLLVAGTSGSGKSTITSGFLERMAEADYQYLIVDPEGDYSGLERAVVLGAPERVPTVGEVLDLLAGPEQNVVVNLLGIPLEQRPAFFESLLPRIQELRARTGRPHWVVVDEAHHLLPSTWDPTTLTFPLRMTGMLLITVHPEQIAPTILSLVDLLLAVGDAPGRTLASFCSATGQAKPQAADIRLQPGEVAAWRARAGTPPVRVRCAPPRAERRRHSRKYAEGSLDLDRSFHFRGPEGKLNLRAQNLVLFLQIAEGVDDASWLYHLERGDYSNWFRNEIKDEDLAREAAEIEHRRGATPQETRAAVRGAVERRYTLPA